MTRLVTWNVAGRVRSVTEQAAVIAGTAADVVLLQEVRSTAASAWTAALHDCGLPHVLLALGPGAPDRDPARRLGVAIASREPARALPGPPLPWPERHLAATVPTRDGEIDVHVVHAPTSAREDAVKVRTLEALVAALTPPGPRPVVLAGDLNTPQYESREGEVRSFARTRTGRLRDGFDERHDRAELAVVPGLRDAGYVDAFRALHGYGARDRSWMYANGRLGYRLDHVLVRDLVPVAAAYEHAWREARLSDHSGLTVDVRARVPAS